MKGYAFNGSGVIERAARLREAGLSNAEIAEAMNISKATVSRYLAHGRKKQIVSPSDYHVSKRPKHICETRGVTLGSVSDILDGISEGAMLWLFDQTDEGQKLASTMADYIEDAYLENLEKQRARDGQL